MENLLDNILEETNKKKQSIRNQKFSGLVDEIIKETNNNEPQDIWSHIQRFKFQPENTSIPNALIPLGSGEPLYLTKHATKRLCSESRIPYEYISSIPEGLQYACVNHGIQNRFPKKEIMIRTFRNAYPQGTLARAILSSKFQPFDDAELFKILLPHISDFDMTVVRADISPYGTTRIMLSWDLPENSHQMRPGDIVKNGLIIRNSEVGTASVDIRGGTYSMICSNGSVVPISETRSRIYHSGRRERMDGAVQNSIKMALEDSQKLIKNYREALTIEISDGEALFQAAMQKGIINQKEEKLMTQEFFNPTDTTRKQTLYDASQAVTRVAQTRSSDRQYDLEIIGADMVSNPQKYLVNSVIH